MSKMTSISEQKVSVKNLARIVLVLSLAFIVAGMGLYQYALSTVGPGDTTEQWFSAETEAAYLIGPYNSTFFFAKNHTGYGLAAYEGYELISTNSTDLIQYCLNITTVEGGMVYVKTGAYAATLTLKNQTRLQVDKGATGITVSIDAGATAIYEDYNAGVSWWWSSGILVMQHNNMNGAIAGIYSTFTQYFGTGGINRTDAVINPTGPYSYIIDKTGSTYRAKNGTTGQIDSGMSSTNATTVLNNIAGNCSDGDTIMVKRGVVYGSCSFPSDTVLVVRTAGQALVEGEVVFRNSTSSGKCWLAKADSAVTMGCGYVYLAVLNATASSKTLLLEKGDFTFAKWTLTVDLAYYVSNATAGGLMTPYPATSGNQVLQIGKALNATTIEYRSTGVVIEIT
jgi:hypothetical protein